MTERDPRELYKVHILDHSKRPRNQGPLPNATHAARCTNPLCGDRVTIELVCEGDAIKAVQFQARGCAIAVAAASMLTEWVSGKTRAEVAQLRADVDRAVNADGGEVAPPADALMALRAFPTRERCATLAWDALAEALSKID